MRILITDDAKFMRLNLGNILKSLGHEVVGEAGNGVEAIGLYKKLKPDLVTMDITMPIMDGITAVKEIKEQDSRAKIIMVSALGQKDYVIQALKNGAIDFILKPFHPEKIKNIFEKMEG